MNIKLLPCILATFAMMSTTKLNADDKPSCRIVIPEKHEYAEKFAAEELAVILKDMTGEELKIVTDAEPAAGMEIVIGKAARKLDTKLTDKPKTIEGFSVDSQDASIFIRGNSPRATLYGVYDFLDKELGVRFLAFDYTYVPKRKLEDVRLSSPYTYDPPFSYRNVISCNDDQREHPWHQRMRMNSVWGYVPDNTVGGLRHLGGFVHNLPKLIPQAKFFDAHPEYYAMVGGERRRMMWPTGKFESQPCLSNPDVEKLVAARIREIMADYAKSKNHNPDDQILFPVDYHDHQQFCECDKCTAINEEEDTPGGTLYRFMNALSEDLSKDYPNLTLTTLAYGKSIKPPKCKLRPNIILRFAPIRMDFAASLHDKANAETMQHLTVWRQKQIPFYVWYYMGNFNDGITPHADIKGLCMNMRILRDYGMRGAFIETVQHAGIEMRELRSYLLGRFLWRPDTDMEADVREFCNLYYGKGGQKVLEYIKYLHKWHYEKVNPNGDNPLTLRGAPPYRHAYTMEFIDKSDAILDEAEALAETEQQKLHVAVMHNPVWYLRVSAAMNSERRVESFPVEWHFKTDPEKNIRPDAPFADWGKIRTDDFWTKQTPYETYHGAAWYATEFEIDEKNSQHCLSLFFGSVDGLVDAYIDGAKVGEQKRAPGEMWNVSFYIHLAKPLSVGRHVLKVRVEKEHAAAGIWKPVAIMNNARELSEKTRNAGLRYMQTEVDFVRSRRGDKFRKNVFERINNLLEAPVPNAPEGSFKELVTKSAATIPTVHKTYDIIPDETAEFKKCMRQIAKDKPYTLGQAMSWVIGDILKKNPSLKWRMRLRMKVVKKGIEGDAVKLGCYYQNKNWSGNKCTPVAVIKASDVKDDGWFLYEYPHELSYEKHDRPQIFSVFAADNPDNIVEVRIDKFELYRK
ncbi:MAG: DUF4838 domain-containing protein [Victivallales bacterium]|nr:DUF4838 domain-containing protein [Victivallales bacterium]